MEGEGRLKWVGPIGRTKSIRAKSTDWINLYLPHGQTRPICRRTAASGGRPHRVWSHSNFYFLLFIFYLILPRKTSLSPQLNRSIATFSTASTFCEYILFKKAWVFNELDVDFHHMSPYRAKDTFRNSHISIENHISALSFVWLCVTNFSRIQVEQQIRSLPWSKNSAHTPFFVYCFKHDV